MSICKDHKICKERGVMKSRSIKRSDGTKINLNKDGNIWLLLDHTGGPCLGTIHSGICTTYWNHGLDNETYKKFLPIDRLLLKYGRKLHIRKIRVEDTKRVETDFGPKLIVKYAYIRQDKFESLLKKRKQKPLGAGNVRKVVLIKRSDFEFKDE